MEILKVTKGKSGTTQKGTPWTRYDITTDEGAFSTFLEGLRPGMVIDVTEMDVSRPNYPATIKKYDLMSQGEQVADSHREQPDNSKTPPQPVKPSESQYRASNNEMSKDDWAEKARIERESIMAQVGAKNGVEYLRMMLENPDAFENLPLVLKTNVMTVIEGAVNANGTWLHPRATSTPLVKALEKEGVELVILVSATQLETLKTLNVDNRITNKIKEHGWNCKARELTSEQAEILISECKENNN